MIDIFSLLLSHGLLLLAIWLLTRRPDLDDDSAPTVAPRSSILPPIGGPPDA